MESCFYDTLKLAAIEMDGLPGGTAVADLTGFTTRRNLLGDPDKAKEIYANLIKRPKAILSLLTTAWSINKDDLTVAITIDDLKGAKDAAFDEAELSPVDRATAEIKLANLGCIGAAMSSNNWKKIVWATTDDNGLITFFSKENEGSKIIIKIHMVAE